MKRISRRTVTAANALTYNGRSGGELMAARDQSATHANALVLCRQHGLVKILRVWGGGRRLVLSCNCRRAAESFDTAHLKSAPTKPAVVED